MRDTELLELSGQLSQDDSHGLMVRLQIPYAIFGSCIGTPSSRYQLLSQWQDGLHGLEDPRTVLGNQLTRIGRQDLAEQLEKSNYQFSTILCCCCCYCCCC